MAAEIFFSLGMIYLEDVLHLIIRHSAILVRMLVECRERNRSSIVRQIGSHMTWIKTKRLHIICGEEFIENSSPYDSDPLNSDCQCIKKPIENGSNTIHLENKVEELQKELFNLQSQVAKILLSQEKKVLNSDEKSKICLNSTENIVSSSTSMIPPPPPLPPTPVMHKPFIKSKSKCKAKTNQIMDNISACSIMEELSSRPPKLRHVQLSPGGRPVRNVSVASNLSDTLTAVLRKRFEALHSPKYERYSIFPSQTQNSPLIPEH